MIGNLTWPNISSHTKEPVLWVAMGLGSFLLFLCLTFPYGALQSRMLSEITRGTGGDVRATHWSPEFPIGVAWHDLTWNKPGGPSFPVQTMRLDVGLLRAIIGQPTVHALMQFPGTGLLGGGLVTGRVQPASWSFLGPVSFDGHLQQIDLAAVGRPYVSRGRLQADISHRWENRGKEGIVFNGDGSWRVEVKELVLDRIPLGVGFVPSLSFSRVTALANCRDTVCDIEELRGDGPDGTVTAQGRIFLQQPLQSSTLELRVTILAGGGWAQKARNLPIPPLPSGTPMTINLTGTVANPTVGL